MVSALDKWAPIIGLQPVTILSDHKSLESWTKEVLDTLSGPAGRRARWHEFLSRFNIQVIYVPGKCNQIPDALSRWAYPASQALADVSFHGSAADAAEMKEIIEEEIKLEHGGVLVVECGRITADEWASIFSTPTAAKRPLALNLFSGTGSVTEALIGMGYDVHTLDVRRVNHPTFCVDILKWDYRAIPPHTYQVIFASPPCEEFSVAKTIGERNLGYALKLVQHTLQIIDFFAAGEMGYGESSNWDFG